MKKIKTLCSRRYGEKKYGYKKKKDAHTKRIQKKEELKEKTKQNARVIMPKDKMSKYCTLKKNWNFLLGMLALNT